MQPCQVQWVSWKVLLPASMPPPAPCSSHHPYPASAFTFRSQTGRNSERKIPTINAPIQCEWLSTDALGHTVPCCKLDNGILSLDSTATCCEQPALPLFPVPRCFPINPLSKGDPLRKSWGAKYKTQAGAFFKVHFQDCTLVTCETEPAQIKGAPSSISVVSHRGIGASG